MSAPTVLVVDDDDLTRKLVAERLERKGLHVVRARDGREALQLARSASPALVLLDIQMPGLSGFEVLRHLRDEPGAGQLKCVAMTASVMPEDQGRTERQGFDAVLVKPFRRNELLHVVGQQLDLSLGDPA